MIKGHVIKDSKDFCSVRMKIKQIKGGWSKVKHASNVEEEVMLLGEKTRGKYGLFMSFYVRFLSKRSFPGLGAQKFIKMEEIYHPQDRVCGSRTSLVSESRNFKLEVEGEVRKGFWPAVETSWNTATRLEGGL